MMSGKVSFILLLVAFVIFSGTIVHALTVETTNGDIIKGEFGTEKIRLALQVGGVVEIGAGEIVEISGESMEALTFRLNDGTVLKGKIADEMISIKTRFGDVTISVSQIKIIDLSVGGAGGVPGESGAVPEGDWKIALEEEVASDNHWRLTFEYVEKKGDTLVVAIGFRNVSENNIQSISLTGDYKETTILLNDDAGTEYNLKNVNGISKNSLSLNPGVKKVATFTFPYPLGVKNARFVSRWSASWGGIPPFSILFTIPPTETKGGE